MRPREPGDIVQIVPDVHDWGGCLAIVDEMKSWGCVAYVSVPGSDGVAYLRLTWDKIVWCGVAVYMASPDKEGAEKCQPH